MYLNIWGIKRIANIRDVGGIDVTIGGFEGIEVSRVLKVSEIKKHWR